MTADLPPLTEQDVLAFVRRFLAEQGFGEPEVAAGSRLVDLGLDSITTVLMFTTAQAELAEAGYTLPEVDPAEAPPVERVSDLVALLGLPVG